MTQNENDIESQVVLKKRRKILTFLFFLFFSSFLWILIKLSASYIIPYKLDFVLFDLPANMWISEDQSTQSLSISINTTGFKLLKIKYLASKKGAIHFPLSQLPYRKQNENMYYLNTLNLQDLIAGFLGINEKDIEFIEKEIFFRIVPMQSKKVRIEVDSKINFKEQYRQYGPIKVFPESVEVFAPKAILDTLNYITTETISGKGIDLPIDDSLNLQYDESLIRPSLRKVAIHIDVEKYTESSVKLNVIKPGKPKIKVFPVEVEVFFSVALKDFDSLSKDQFVAAIDTSGLYARKKLLSVFLKQKPSFVEIIRIEPEQVEYIILKQ